MDAFIVALRPWGLYIAAERTLNREELRDFADAFGLACHTLCQRASDWGMIADLRGVDLARANRDVLLTYMHAARQFGKGRSASIVATWHGAAVYAEALHAAGLATKARVIVVQDSGPAGVRRAYDWVIRGIEPTIPKLIDPTQRVHYEWFESIALTAP